MQKGWSSDTVVEKCDHMAAHFCAASHSVNRNVHHSNMGQPGKAQTGRDTHHAEYIPSPTLGLRVRLVRDSIVDDTIN